MKYINIIKLLSVLLCIGMLFVACNNNEEDPTERPTGDLTEAPTEPATEKPTELVTEEPLLENIENNFENFFDMSVPEAELLKEPARFDGEIVNSDNLDNVVITKEIEIDTKNNVTETFRVYNLRKATTVLTLENTYAGGHYDEFDWSDLTVDQVGTHVGGTIEIEKAKNYPAKILDVSLYENEYPVDEINIPVIIVKEATVTPIDNSTLAGNPKGCVYEITTKYTYYDISGTKITESATSLPIYAYRYEFMIGSLEVIFDSETYEIERFFDWETQKAILKYAETDEFGYFLNSSYNVPGGKISFMEIYSKATGELIHRYYFNDNYSNVSTHILHNGDVLIQYFNVVKEGEPYDFYYDVHPLDSQDGDYMLIAHEIFDVRDGKSQEIDLPYFIMEFEWGKNIADEFYEKEGIRLSENVRNLALVRPIEDKILREKTYVVFDNDMSVLYEYEPIIPEQLIDGISFGVAALANGDYLVTLDSPTESPYAIVNKDRSVRSYLKAEMIVVGNYVLDQSKGIYDYDLNLIYDFTDEDTKYEFDCIIGDTIIISAKETAGNTTEWKYAYNGNAAPDRLFGGRVEITEIAEDYIIVINEDGKTALYNSDFTHLLTSDNGFEIIETEGGYIIKTYSGLLEKTLVYMVRF